MDNVIVEPKNISSVMFTVFPDRSMGIDVWCGHRTRSCKKNNVIYFSSMSGSNDSPEQIIQDNTLFRNITSGSTLYVSKSSKLPRDLIRNSGYKITLSPEKADYIIIPKPVKELSPEKYNIIIRDTVSEEVFICGIRNMCLSLKLPVEKYVEKLAFDRKRSVADFEYYSPSSVADTEFYVCFTQDVPEFIDILRGNTSGKDYVFDTDLPLIPSSNMSVETMDLWARLLQNDQNIFEKAVINSDANKYPFTLHIFLNYDKDVRYHYWGQQFRDYLRRLGIYEGFDGYRTIEPHDVELVQKWIMKRMGADEDGGIVNFEMYNNMPYQICGMIRKRFVVKPVKVSGPITYTNLISQAKN